MTELNIDKRNRELGKQLRQTVDLVAASLKAGRETIERNREADRKAHEAQQERKDKRNHENR